MKRKARFADFSLGAQNAFAVVLCSFVVPYFEPLLYVRANVDFRLVLEA